MKYKISGPGFIKIDDAGNKSATFRKEDKPGTMGANLYLEMINSGIKIEPEFDAEELAAQAAEKIEAEKVAYIGLRKSEYPDPMQFNDAKVKQHSDDENIQAEGIAQEQQYYADCLDVKKRIPKPNLE